MDTQWYKSTTQKLHVLQPFFLNGKNIIKNIEE